MSAWERERNRRIARIQGSGNPYVEGDTSNGQREGKTEEKTVEKAVEKGEGKNEEKTADRSSAEAPAWTKGRDSSPLDPDRAAFAAFRLGFERAPARTLERFAQLVAQGGEPHRAGSARLARELAAACAQTPRDQALAGLSLLETLALRETLGQLTAAQLHLFAADDALVPGGACQAVADCLPASGRAERIAAAGHAFPRERASETAARMVAFITSHRLEHADVGSRP